MGNFAIYPLPGKERSLCELAFRSHFFGEMVTAFKS